MDLLTILITIFLGMIAFSLIYLVIFKRPKRRSLRDVAYDIQNTVEDTNRQIVCETETIREKLDFIIDHIKKNT